MLNLDSLFGPQNQNGSITYFKCFPKVGRERWMLENCYSEPWHLETWPQTNIRAKVIYFLARFLGFFKLHLPHKLKGYTIVTGSIYDLLKREFSSLGIFLGTPGPNRKLVIYASGSSGSWFVKVPLNTRSLCLVRSEFIALKELNSDVSLSCLVPNCKWIGDALAIQDVREPGVSYSELSVDEVFRVYQLLATKNIRTTKNKTFIYLVRRKGLTQLNHKSSASDLISNLKLSVRELLDVLNLEEIDWYKCHGDFTLWNTLVKLDGTTKIIDWELYGWRPIYFDCFHYYISKAILLENKPPIELLNGLNLHFHNRIHADDYIKYLSLYIIWQSSEYCSLFEMQSDLHEQAYWQLNCWLTISNILRDKVVNKERL